MDSSISPPVRHLLTSWRLNDLPMQKLNRGRRHEICRVARAAIFILTYFYMSGWLLLSFSIKCQLRSALLSVNVIQNGLFISKPVGRQTLRQDHLLPATVSGSVWGVGFHSVYVLMSLCCVREPDTHVIHIYHDYSLIHIVPRSCLTTVRYVHCYSKKVFR